CAHSPTLSSSPSTTLFRSRVVLADAVGERGYVPPEGEGAVARGAEAGVGPPGEELPRHAGIDVGALRAQGFAVVEHLRLQRIAEDRKSTRLNSSHQIISYA